MNNHISEKTIKPDPSTKILIADAVAHTRENMAVFFSEQGLDVVGTAATGKETKTLAASTAPDVIILDINLPDIHFQELASALTRADNSPKVILMMVREDRIIAQQGIEAGAYACLAKNNGIDPLIQVVREI